MSKSKKNSELEAVNKDEKVLNETGENNGNNEPDVKSEAMMNRKPEEKSEETMPEKEALDDSEIVDINKEELSKKETDKATSSNNMNLTKHAKKKSATTADFIAAEKRKKRRKRFIVLAILAIIGISGFFYIKKKVGEAKALIEQAMSSNVQTAPVEKKTIKNTVTATGTMLSNETRTLTTILQSSSKIIEVNVAVGDYVNEGDVLVKFSTDDIYKQISEAKEDISTQRKQDSITAQDNTRSYLYSYSSSAFGLSSAAKSVDQALNDLHEACSAYGEAKRKLQQAKDEGAGYDPDPKVQESLDAQYEQKIASLESQVAQTYQAQVAAQDKYDQSVVNEAKSIADTQNGLSDADSKYQTANITAGSQVKTMERKLEDLQDSLENYEVTASISGIVTDVNVSEGNSFQNGEVLTIQDMSQYTIELMVDEYDISSVKKAYEKALSRNENLGVVIKTDATEDREFAGHVISISPTSTSTAKESSGSSGSSSGGSSGSSTVNYKVKVVVDEMDETFMVGMSAKAAIVVEQSPADSYAVPYNAVFQNEETGEYFVKVVDNSAPEIDDFGDDSVGTTKDGIVVENSTTQKGDKKGPDGKRGGMMSGLASDFDTMKNKDAAVSAASNEPQKTREVMVEKVFETDYYTAIIPKNKSELSENDEVILSNEDSGNSMFGMMGPMMY